jgi:hypothetical protein
LAELPDEGWCWQVTRAAAAVLEGARATHLGAFAVSMSPLFRGSGLPTDSWLRTHLRVGGRIVKPARQAMVVDVPLGMWEVWLGRPLDGREREVGATFEIPGALAPVLVRDDGHGLYEEPGVWVHHPSEAAE